MANHSERRKMYLAQTILPERSDAFLGSIRDINARQGKQDSSFGHVYIGVDGSIWPLTLVATRYGGVYERGKFAAFPCDTDKLPEGYDGGDNECDEFWTNARERELTIGIGNTPNDAYADLLARLRSE